MRTSSVVNWSEWQLSLVHRAQKLLEERVKWYVDEYVAYLDYCESPIEQILFIALYEKANRRGFLVDPSFHIEMQHKVHHQGKTYRVDIYLGYGNCKCFLPNSDAVKKAGVKINLAIECDGHDFHEKTKEQAGRDKYRDRALVSEGYTVLHFTGSEIVQNPVGCATEILDLLDKQLVESNYRGIPSSLYPKDLGGCDV